ncbi:MAG TPA: phosphoglycerate kinase [Candidatus Paceibacterota bacterium]|nr:phosphoglycerate kinase [Candidatus Paceibacterota bacterium]
MRSIATLPKLNGARVLVRVDYNVPIKGNTILDARRIESSYKTIDAVLKKGGVPIVIAHRGEDGDTLRPIVPFLSKRYHVLFISHRIGSSTIDEAIGKAKKGTVVLLENIRQNPGEEKNDLSFAKALAALGKYFINDAFSVCHRLHASIVRLPKLLPAYAGYQLLVEVAHLDGVLKSKAHPFLFVLGGAKFSTKIPLIKKFITTADNTVIAGALLNSFYKTAGFEIGRSVYESGYEKQIRPLLKNPRLLLPTDVVVLAGKKATTVSADAVSNGDMIVDIGPDSTRWIDQKIREAKLIVWNGPTGWYEGGFDTATVALARAIARSRATTIIGGGDTAEVIKKVFKNANGSSKRIFISTGGGATLEYLAKGTLPGIQCLQK